MTPSLRMQGTALEMFSGLAGSYERVLDIATLYQDRAWKKWIVQRVRPSSGELVLDLGCGTLVMEERLRGTGCDFVGLDLTPEMLEGGKAKELKNVPMLLRADAENLPFRDSCFDVVVSCYVPKYVDLDGFAREASRVARPGGRLGLYDFVRPQGLASPFLRFYVHWFLGAAGALLKLTGRGEAATFGKLPWIVEGAVWAGKITAAMGRTGVGRADSATLTGGTVFAYFGVKEAGGHTLHKKKEEVGRAPR